MIDSSRKVEAHDSQTALSKLQIANTAVAECDFAPRAPYFKLIPWFLPCALLAMIRIPLMLLLLLSPHLSLLLLLAQLLVVVGVGWSPTSGG